PRARMRRSPALPTDIPAGAVPDALDTPFRIRAVTYSARQVAAYALVASGSDPPELEELDLVQPATPRRALAATQYLALEHASIRSVWFQNSIRPGLRLAVADHLRRAAGLQP